MEQSQVGKVLRDLRGPRTATEVAAAVGISGASLYQYEAGRLPSRRNQLRLAAYYGKKPDEIWRGDTTDA